MNPPPAIQLVLVYLLVGGAPLPLLNLRSPVPIVAAANANAYFLSSESSADNNDAYRTWMSNHGDEYDMSLFLPSPTTHQSEEEAGAGGDGVALHWSIDSTKSTIRLAVAARLRSSGGHDGGWVGFGLAEVGGMPGSDVVMFTSSDGRLVDAHVGADSGRPIPDACQNWDLIRSSSSSANDGFNYNFVIFEAERLLDTGDTQDRPIVDDSDPNVPPHRIIAAWGDEKDVSYHGMDRVHGAIRFHGRSSASSSADGQQLDEDMFRSAMADESEGYLDLTAEDRPLPADHTLYISPCFTLRHLRDLGLPKDDAVHVIGFEPLIGRAGSNLHHLGLVSYDGHDCSRSSPGGSGEGVSVFIWAPGEGPLELPPDVGASVGKHSSTKSYKLQVHYNPAGVYGLVDSSGVRLYYTTQLRQHELGYMEIGDPWTYLDGMSVGEGLTRYTFDCPGSCSETFDVGEVTVMREMLHMHKAGTRMVNQQIRGEEVIREATVEHYDYRNGGIVSVMQDSYKLRRGDMFKTSCYYDSPDEGTTFGFETENEMCIAFILYYPKQDIDRCGLHTAIKSCRGGYDREELSDASELGRVFGVEPEECEEAASEQ